ncbi:hypothetical protein PR048_031010 [Dryococelus australis]|uniref:Uncharacterized protein n=1 Tax=Dryococelus australis TaxID=614101 RepID=A0ABQ9G420_9NEOP|nr:hypothetical protein PR048_031010 [Dryococelus australis]
MLEEDTRNVIPETLKVFTENVTKKDNELPKSLHRKQIIINHSIIAACRSRSFHSTIHIALAVYLYRRYGSRLLIDVFHSMGVCSSYSEAKTYLKCGTVYVRPVIDDSAFFQFVFDNADVNIRTLTGLGTFHSLGSIKCVTPLQAVYTPSAFPHDTSIRPDSKKKLIPVKMYKKAISGFKTITITPIHISGETSKEIYKATALDVLWAAGYTDKIELQPSWNGYMQSSMAQAGGIVTQTIPLPFIYLNPSNLNTLYSALHFACSDIVLSADKDSPVASVVVRLGGFHLLVSFLGSIGYVMNGGGIEELWETVYARNSIPHMLTGHAFSRAVRTHILTAAALIKLIIHTNPDSTDMCDNLLKLRSRLFNRKVSCKEASENEILLKFVANLNNKCQDLETKSRTEKLWLMYLHQVFLMLHVILAEDRKLGFTYCHYYPNDASIPFCWSHTLCKDMLTLLAANDGTSMSYFIRELEKVYYRWVFHDQASRERMGRYAIEVASAVEALAGISHESSEQRKDLQDSSMTIDSKHMKIFLSFLKQHNPFYISEDLVNIFSGVVGDDTVTCDSMKVRDNVVPVNVQQLFNRIIFLNNTSQDLKEYFQYELFPTPPALLKNNRMRKGTKSSLVSVFVPEEEEGENETFGHNAIHVIYGGHLLNCVVWSRPGTYGDVLNVYKCYIERHFGKETIVVFDGYPDTPTTKGEARSLRYRKPAPVVLFNDSTYISPTQSDSVAISQNKRALISVLITHLHNASIEIYQATADTDAQIIRVALQHTADGERIIVVGQDTDLQQEIHHHTRDVLLFRHGMSGCDPTSSIFRKGKEKCLKLLEKEELQRKVTVFNEENSTYYEIAKAGIWCIAINKQHRPEKGDVLIGENFCTCTGPAMSSPVLQDVRLCEIKRDRFHTRQLRCRVCSSMDLRAKLFLRELLLLCAPRVIHPTKELQESSLRRSYYKMDWNDEQAPGLLTSNTRHCRMGVRASQKDGLACNSGPYRQRQAERSNALAPQFSYHTLLRVHLVGETSCTLQSALGIVSTGDCQHRGLSALGIVSTGDCQHRGLSALGIVSTGDCQHWGLSAQGIVSTGKTCRE